MYGLLDLNQFLNTANTLFLINSKTKIPHTIRNDLRYNMMISLEGLRTEYPQMLGFETLCKDVTYRTLQIWFEMPYSAETLPPDIKALSIEYSMKVQMQTISSPGPFGPIFSPAKREPVKFVAVASSVKLVTDAGTIDYACTTTPQFEPNIDKANQYTENAVKMFLNEQERIQFLTNQPYVY